MIENLRNTALYKQEIDLVETKNQLIILSNDLNRVLKLQSNQNIKSMSFFYEGFDFNASLSNMVNEKIMTIDSVISYKNISHSSRDIIVLKLF